MIKKEGKFPVNARVDIDYSGKTPKIKFGYTSNNPKKDAMKQHRTGIHTIIIFLILYFAIGYLAVWGVIEGDYPEQCSIEFNKINKTSNISIDIDSGESYRAIIINSTYKKVVTGANITCDGETYPIRFKKDIGIFSLATGDTKGFYHKVGDSSSGLISTLYIPSILFLFIVFGYYLNKLVTYLLLKSKRYRKGFPRFNAKIIRSRKYMKFKPEDVENNIVEIPSFSNVELDYKTKGDFSKQLQKIKIREHTHYRYKKGKKYGKLKRDICKWYARFFFKETPKDGHLEVVYH